MVRNYLLCGITTMLATLTAQAQVPNAGFEIMDANNNISQWGKAFLMSITIDSNGNSITDSIVFDNADALYFPTTDAHSGQQAMEMRNAYNYTAGAAITGGAILSDGEGYAIFPVPVQIAPVTSPEKLTFWYQFIPAGNDTAEVTLALMDVDGYELGYSTLRIGAPTNGYTLAEMPIEYTQFGEVQYIMLVFSTAIPGTSATMGTRFIVDDVAFEGTLGIAENKGAGISVSPNPANNLLTISSSVPVEYFFIVNAAGQTIETKSSSGNTIDCSSWQPGIYFLNITASGQTSVQKVVIRH